MDGAWNTFFVCVAEQGCRALPRSSQDTKAGHVAAKEMSRTQKSYSDDEVRWQGCEREQGGIDVVTGQAIMPRRHEGGKRDPELWQHTALTHAKARMGLIHASVNIYSRPGVIGADPRLHLCQTHVQACADLNCTSLAGDVCNARGSCVWK